MKTTLPPAYFLGAIVLMVALNFVFPGYRFLRYPWLLLGLVPLADGITLNVLADRAFTKRETTVKPFEQPRALVVDGVFRFSRNPMYLGMTLILLGIGLLLGSATPIAVIPAFAWLVDRAFIVPEEEMLKETFGNSFDEYRRRVRRWI